MADIDSLLFNIASFIAGLFLLQYGADKFIDHTAVVARRLNVSPTLVGLLTCGAEWEELVVIAVALGQKNQALALGNLMGSSIANILASFSLGLIFIKTATFDRSSKIYAAALLGLTLLFLLLLFTLSASLKWVAGALLIVAFVVYVASVASAIYKGVMTAPEDDSDSDSDGDGDGDGDGDSDSESDGGDDATGESDDEEKCKRRSEKDRRRSSSSTLGTTNSREMELLGVSKTRARFTRLGPHRSRPKPLRSHIFKLLLGLCALLVSSYIVAHSAGSIGSELGLSGTVVGTTILSLATTLPEKFVAIMGGVRHQPGIMVANTVGSNIFLVTLCGGILLLWGDAEQLRLSFGALEASAMLGSAVLILGIVLGGGRRWMGGVMLGLYVAFLISEFASGRGLVDDD
ncbi:Sodium/calcium exchanger protein-domain-containing protein [Coniochaeta sp. 2T2.1]|nr:Sodium/calcium exchanger protein-domain-containing protein [Coniochaeta sp. 2T2.1]